MIKIKDFIKKYRNYILVIGTIAIMCVLYVNYLKGHFSTEAYGVAQGYKSYAINAYIADGRLFSGLFLLLADFINIPAMWLIRISVFLGICIATFAILKLKNSIASLAELTIKQEIVTWIICILIIFNFVMIELLHFPEACIMSLSIFMYVFAAKYFIDKKYIRTFIFLLLGIFSYQGTIGFFVVVSCLFCVIRYKKICKEECFDFVKIIVITLIAAILNLIFIKSITMILQVNQNKTFDISFESIVKNIGFILENGLVILTQNCDLFPEYTNITYVEIIIVMAIIMMLKEKNYEILIKVLFLICISLASSFALFTIQTNSFFTGRVHFCIGAMVGIGMLYLYCKTNIKNNKILVSVYSLIIVSYLILNVFNTVQVLNEHKIANEYEKNECIKIKEMIEKYENENEVKVEKLVPVLIFNQKYKGFSEEVTRHTIVTYNNVRHYFGYAGIINYYLDYYGMEKLKGVKANDNSQIKYKEYIDNVGGEYGDIVCIEDTLYCPQYIY